MVDYSFPERIPTRLAVNHFQVTGYFLSPLSGARVVHLALTPFIWRSGAASVHFLGESPFVSLAGLEPSTGAGSRPLT
jgi:hypothetical protein